MCFGGCLGFFSYTNDFSEIYFLLDFFFNEPILLVDFETLEAASKTSNHNVMNCLNFEASALKRKSFQENKTHASQTVVLGYAKLSHLNK